MCCWADYKAKFYNGYVFTAFKQKIIITLASCFSPISFVVVVQLFAALNLQLSSVKNGCPTCISAFDLLVFISSLHTVEHFFFFGASFSFLSSSPLPLLLTSFSIPLPEASLIEVEPVSPYTVFTANFCSFCFNGFDFFFLLSPLLL